MYTNKSIQVMQLLLAIIILLTVVPRLFVGPEAIYWNKLTYYTVQTNVLIAIYLFLVAIRPSRLQETSYGIFRLMITVAISITGLCYFLFLHEEYIITLHEDFANGIKSTFIFWYDFLNTYVNHLVVPVIAVVEYLLLKPHAQLKKRHIFYPLAIPFTYFIFHTVRGLVSGYYKYTFLNPSEMGGWENVFYMFCGLTCLVMFISWILFVMTNARTNHIDHSQTETNKL